MPFDFRLPLLVCTPWYLKMYLLNVTVSHVQCKYGNISETVQNEKMKKSLLLYATAHGDCCFLRHVQIFLLTYLVGSDIWLIE